jgi:hypothetical protein
VSECDREASTVRRPWPTRGCCPMEGKIKNKILDLVVSPFVTMPIQTLGLIISQYDKKCGHTSEQRCPELDADHS